MMRNSNPFAKISIFMRSMVFLVSFLFLVSGKVFSEKAVLLELKKSISDPQGILSSWEASNPNYCTWFGVTCSSESRVLELRVSGGNFAHSASCSLYSDLALHGFGIERNCSAKNGKLVGKLSSAIGKLNELRVLSLPFHELSGELPSEIWGLRNLEVIDLEGNLISGNLSGDFAGLRNLRVLNLGFNKIDGEIPSSLAECRGLSTLNLAGNHVKGVIPRFFGSFVRLKGLYLSFNRFVGSVPDELGNNCQSLEHLDLSGNHLQGKIPHSLGNCRQLRTLLLFSNGFDGDVPFELGKLGMLEVLDVSRNSLRGHIPEDLGNCVNLSVLVLSSHFNQLSIMRKTRGKGFYGLLDATLAEHNHFEGSIPLRITMLPKLKILWAPSATLGGKFPSNWGNCDCLEMVNFAGNFFTGGISGVFGGCKNLQFLNLSSNRINGQLDENFQVPCMALFDVSGNHMSGTIPRFNYNPCPILPPFKVDIVRPVTLSSVYLSFFAHKIQLENPLPLSASSIPMIHNFGQNYFTGSIPPLPISPERRSMQIEYAFIAGGNNLSGSFDGILSGRCNRLKGILINVSENMISGQIPSNIGLMSRCLKFLDASKNQISGPIPVGLINLRKLIVLLLDNNKLSGKMPSGFVHMRSLTKFNLSFNNLSGPLVLDPKVMNCSSFLGNPFLRSCPVVPLSMPPSDQQTENESLNSSASGSENGKNGFNSIEIASIISASVVVLILLALVAFFFYIRKWKPNYRVEVSEPSDRRELMVFKDVGVPLTFDSVVQATGNFTASNCIGSGGFGATYRADVSPGTTVAVKRLTIEMCQGVTQFNAEIRSLGRIQHPNLITLIGYCASKAEMFLIYNYLPGGNLEQFIRERASRDIDWKVLQKIALNIASALAYLHEQCVPRILHRDVKPSNILLDDEFNAYLSDFGLSRLLEGFETHVTTGVAGTFGYVAPEYALTCRVSEKADVYSYGVMLLELISDKRALDPSFSAHENGFTIVSWAVMLMREAQATEVFAAGLWDAGPEDALMEMLHLAIVCTCESPSTRPTMRQVARRLRQLEPPLS